MQTEFGRLREALGFNYIQAANRLGVSESTARRYESGESTPRPTELEVLRRIVRFNSLAPSQGHDFRFVDLFAGIGGLRLGMESIGGRCVFTSEWDKYAQQTYKANFHDDPDAHVFAGDIRPFGADPSLIPEHDVLVAGFPCQPFSLAGVSKKNSLGRKHGFECEDQGNLFFEIERIIAHHKPAAFLLENVKNLERHDKGQTFAVIRDRLTNALGYHIDWRVISSHPWVPQKRERIFIVGFREETGFSFNGFEKQIPPESDWPRLGSILQSHNEVDSKYTLTEHLWNYLQRYKEKHSAKGNGFGCSVVGPDDVTRTLSARYHKDGSEILVETLADRPRRLTPTECARLMGFEDENRRWKIPVSDTQAYRQFGNSVVVPKVEAVAQHMKPYLDIMLGNGNPDFTSIDKPVLARAHG